MRACVYDGISVGEIELIVGVLGNSILLNESAQQFIYQAFVQFGAQIRYIFPCKRSQRILNKII